MKHARVNSFGDLVIENSEGSVSYPTEFTKLIARYRKDLPKSSRIRKRFIVAVLEVPGNECLIHQIQEELIQCDNGFYFTVVPLTSPSKKMTKNKDIFINTYGKFFQNKFINHRMDEVLIDEEENNQFLHDGNPLLLDEELSLASVEDASVTYFEQYL